MSEQLNIESPYLNEFNTKLDYQDDEIEVLIEQIIELIKSE